MQEKEEARTQGRAGEGMAGVEDVSVSGFRPVLVSARLALGASAGKMGNRRPGVPTNLDEVRWAVHAQDKSQRARKINDHRSEMKVARGAHHRVSSLCAAGFCALIIRLDETSCAWNTYYHGTSIMDNKSCFK